MKRNHALLIELIKSLFRIELEKSSEQASIFYYFFIERFLFKKINSRLRFH
jgi:hypothetical protein